MPQSIDSAPLDGEFLALSPNGDWLLVHNQTDVFNTGKRIVCHGLSGKFFSPSYWMPIIEIAKP